jgi:hypothetical protein
METKAMFKRKAYTALAATGAVAVALAFAAAPASAFPFACMRHHTGYCSSDGYEYPSYSYGYAYAPGFTYGRRHATHANVRERHETNKSQAGRL